VAKKWYDAKGLDKKKFSTTKPANTTLSTAPAKLVRQVLVKDMAKGVQDLCVELMS
jgi:hypothetical protein